MGWLGPSDQDSTLAIQDRAGNVNDLLWQLPFGEDHLANATTLLPV